MIFETIQEIISKQLGIKKDSIRLESNILQDLDADSIEAIEIIMSIEDEYGVEFPENAIAEILTVQDLVDFIEGHMEH